MTMNNDNTKIKYLIGSFRDEPGYPSTEDFNYLMQNWFYHEGGHHFIHSYRGIEETGKPCFPGNILIEKLNGDEKVAKNLLDSLLANDEIKVLKETRFTTYYEIQTK
jgi:hypothetical protein